MPRLTSSVLLCVILLLSACNSKQEMLPPAGTWILKFQVDSLDFPIGLTIDSTGIMTIHNAEEVIRLDSMICRGDSFFVDMPLFQSSLSGRVCTPDSISGLWQDHSRQDYAIPFHAVRGNIIFPEATESWETFDVTFSPDSAENMYKAVLKLASDPTGNFVKGTFLTETGDYRYLSGEKEGSRFYLSCFDGSHLFYFNAALEGDSIRDGLFCSGKHWSEPWEARKDDNAGLQDPDSLTYIVPGSGEFNFSARNMQGDPVAFGNEHFEGKLTVVQLFGSWCPNCADESKWLSGMYNKYHQDGFQVIPVAFERGEDFQAQTQGILRQWKSLEMPYPPFLGGRANKGEASQVFPMLNKVMSYPTAIIIDKKGVVRKIHTGFYGPGTGKYFQHHTERLELFFRQLLEE